MNYTTLIGAQTTAGSIAAWVNHSSVVANAPTIIEEAESFIYRRLRHFRMLNQTTGTMTISSGNISFPSDYLEDKILYITGVNYMKLVRKTPEEVVASYSYDSTGTQVNDMPLIYCNDNTSIRMDSPANLAYPYLLWYYQQPAALSASNTTNFLTTYYPRLMRAACMAGASEFMKDAGMGNYDRTYWEQNALAEIAVAQAESDRSVRSMEVGMILT